MLFYLVPHRYYDSLRFAIVDSRKTMTGHLSKGGLNWAPHYPNRIWMLYYAVSSYVQNLVFAVAHLMQKFVFALARIV